MKKQKHKVLKYILLVLAIVVLGTGGYMIHWIMDTYQPDADAIQAMQSDEAVTVSEQEQIVFMPKEKPTKGFIFYPGGLVEPESYAPLCRQIADEGYLVVIAPMKWNLAVLSPDRANDIIADYPEIATWAIGGHSLGGVMAGDYALDHKSIRGVVFYASYPNGDKMKDSDLEVLSIYGELDGIADLEKVKNAALPASSSFVEIKGGNHCGFGSYGMQKGDNEAKVSAKEQQQQAAKATAEFLKQL